MKKKTLPTTELFVDGGSFVSLPLSEQQLTSRVLLPSSSSSSFVSIACVVLYTGSKRKEYKRKQGVKKEGKKESMEKSKKRDGMENNPFLSLSLSLSLLLSPLYGLPVSAPSCCASNSASCCSLSISMMSGTTSTRNDVVAIQAALPVERASFHEA